VLIIPLFPIPNSPSLFLYFSPFPTSIPYITQFPILPCSTSVKIPDHPLGTRVLFAYNLGKGSQLFLAYYSIWFMLVEWLKW
jgi:hypothetical protein